MSTEAMVDMIKLIRTYRVRAIGEVWHKPIENSDREAKGMLQDSEQNAMIYTVKSGRESARAADLVSPITNPWKVFGSKWQRKMRISCCGFKGACVKTASFSLIELTYAFLRLLGLACNPRYL